MQIERQIRLDFEIQASTISYEKAQLLLKINLAKIDLEKKRATANYLYGRKRGVWRRHTMADEKRGWKIQQIAESIKYMEQKFNEMQ